MKMSTAAEGHMSRGSKQISYDITRGVRTDFESLLLSFADLDTVRYEEFANLWRMRKMSLIYSGRRSDREVREFMEKVFKIAIQFYLPPFNFQVRIGALYLLFGLYFTQPCVPKVKIRVTCPCWNEIHKFQQEVANEAHHDVTFIFQRLYLEGAFVFSAYLDEVTIGRRDQKEVVTGARELREDDTVISDIFSADMLKQLSAIQKQYQTFKTCLAGPTAVQPDRSLNIAHKHLIQDLIRELDTFHTNISKHSTRVAGAEDFKMLRKDTEGDDEMNDLLQLKSKRAQIKKQASASLATAKRHRRHRAAHSEEADFSPSKSARKMDYKRSRMTSFREDSDEATDEEDNVVEASLQASASADFHMLATEIDTGTASDKDVHLLGLGQDSDRNVTTDEEDISMKANQKGKKGPQVRGKQTQVKTSRGQGRPHKSAT